MKVHKEPVVVPFELGSLEHNQSEQARRGLSAVAERFCRELRRALPFLARQHARVVLGEARPIDDAELPPLVDGPSFLITLESNGDLWAALHFDASAIGALLDGLFGARGAEGNDDDHGAASARDSERRAIGEALTLAQRALLKRLGRDMAKELAAAVRASCKTELGLSELTGLERGKSADLPEDTLAVDCRIEGTREPWAIRVYMGAEGLTALAALEAPVTPRGPSMAQAAMRVPVNVVAELGRVTLKLSQVLALRAGDTLRLPSATNDPVLVRVEGVPKFDAVPVISRGQVAVKIQSRHSE